MLFPSSDSSLYIKGKSSLPWVNIFEITGGECSLCEQFVLQTSLFSTKMSVSVVTDGFHYQAPFASL